MKVFIADVCDADRVALVNMMDEIPGIELMGSFKDAYHTIEALLAYSSQNGAPDLMFIDMDLATGSGVGVLRFVKNKLPAVKVVMLCSCGSCNCMDNSQTNGADYFLYKPLELGELRNIINELSSTNGRPKVVPIQKSSAAINGSDARKIESSPAASDARDAAALKCAPSRCVQ